MKIKDFTSLQYAMAAECIATSEKKGADYADSENTFASFERGADLARILGIDITTRRGDALYSLVRKLSRLCNLERKGVSVPVNESIHDTVKDMHVYLDLYFGMFTEDITKKK